jgi:MFS family permease
MNRRFPLAVVLLAAAGTFALTMGVRQTMGLFIGPINTATGLGLASISLAFAIGQLCWGLTQPFAGAVADRVGAGRVLLAGTLLVAAGTALTPFMTSTLGLVLAVGVLAAGGAGMAGPAVLMAATTRLIAPEKRGIATGVVNAGGSTGQFLLAPVAAALIAGIGWSASLEVRTAASCCCSSASSSAASTSPSSPRTCRAWWRAAACRPSGPAGRWRCWAASTSSAAWPSAGPSGAGR